MECLARVKGFWMYNDPQIKSVAQPVWGVSGSDCLCHITWPPCSLGSEYTLCCPRSHVSGPQCTLPCILWFKLQTIAPYQLQCFYCTDFSVVIATWCFNYRKQRLLMLSWMSFLSMLVSHWHICGWQCVRIFDFKLLFENQARVSITALNILVLFHSVCLLEVALSALIITKANCQSTQKSPEDALSYNITYSAKISSFL